MLAWALLADTLPIYPLYALFFADTGLSAAQISALFAIWSATSVVAEVPSGALADRFGRRNALVAAGVLQAAGYVLWVSLPGFAGFAAGFVLWGLGGALLSGAREALLYDGLAAVGARPDYTRANGWVNAATLVAEPPSALLATVLFPIGGYVLAGWVSVVVCLLAAALAATLPEPPATGEDPDDEGADDDDAECGGTAPDADDEPGYLDTLRAGVREAAGHPAVRGAVLAVTFVGGIDAVEEYFPLVTADLGVPVALVALAMVPISLASALGSALAGHADRLRPVTLGALLTLAMVSLGAGGLLPVPLLGIAAICLGYGVYHAVLVVTEARLQHRIRGTARATVTSVAGLGVEITTFAVYAAWAFGGLPAVAGAGLAVALALPLLLRGGTRGTRAVEHN
jgi:predicted MFS family arabinose efflux permease